MSRQRTRASIADTVRDAQKTVRQQKRDAPHIFPEYVAMRHAAQELKQAQDRFAAARRAWVALGANASANA